MPRNLSSRDVAKLLETIGIHFNVTGKRMFTKVSFAGEFGP